MSGYLLVDARGTQTWAPDLTAEQLEKCRRSGIIVIEMHSPVRRGHAEEQQLVTPESGADCSCGGDCACTK